MGGDGFHAVRHRENSGLHEDLVLMLALWVSRTVDSFVVLKDYAGYRPWEVYVFYDVVPRLGMGLHEGEFNIRQFSGHTENFRRKRDLSQVVNLGGEIESLNPGRVEVHAGCHALREGRYPPLMPRRVGVPGLYGYRHGPYGRHQGAAQVLFPAPPGIVFFLELPRSR